VPHRTYAHALELSADVLSVAESSLQEIWGEAPARTAVGSLVPPEEDTAEAVQLAYEAIEDAGLLEKVVLGATSVACFSAARFD
jgi:hypothetical protein